MDRLHAGLVVYKSRRGHGNVYIPWTVVFDVLASSTLLLPREDADDPERVQEGALRVLRNEPGSGIGFFRKSGFYPDFILWMTNAGTSETHIRFVEPHGMHHDRLDGANADKIAALKDLAEISGDSPFRDAGVTLPGWIITTSTSENFPEIEKLGWDVLRNEHRVLDQNADTYIETILQIPENDG